MTDNKNEKYSSLLSEIIKDKLREFLHNIEFAISNLYKFIQLF